MDTKADIVPCRATARSWCRSRGTAIALAFLCTGAVPALVSPLTAQSSRITGRVVDTRTSSPIAHVRVTIESNGAEAVTDLDGRYLLTGVHSGTVTVVAQGIGFGMKRVTGVSVPNDGTATLDISLDPVVLQLQGITVTAELERGAAAAVLDVRRTSQFVMDAVGSEEISRLPASDAADVAQRMPGVTVTDGRYVFVRGLGERYSQTSLNGSALPSPEPEREVVPLDLFPSQFLETVSMQKTYTPDRPADFSGGTVQIETRDFPDRPSGSFGASVGFNSASQFRDGFLTYPGGGLDILGVDDGTRQLPDIIDQQFGGLKGDRVPSDPEMRRQIGLEFPRRFGPSLEQTPVSRSFDVSFGSRGTVLGKEVGLLLGGTYTDEYTIRENEIERKYRTDAFNPDIPEARRVPNVDYTFDRGTRNVRIGGVGNLTFLLSPVHKIAIRTTFNLNTDDEARRYVGLNSEDLGGLLRSDRLRFVSRKLYWGQLTGEHSVFLGSRLEWRATMARARRDEPGLREAIYINDNLADPEDEYYLQRTGESGRYLYSELIDDDMSVELDWHFPFTVWSGLNASVKIGGAYRDRERDFAARRFVWQFLSGIVTDIDAALSDETIVGRATAPNQFAITDIVEPGDQYQALDERSAGYLMLEIPFTNSIRSIIGARVEKYDLTIASRDADVSGLDEMDVLPALNLVVDVGTDMVVRAGVSQTLDRPEFRELAPFQFTEAASLRQVVGNPDLQVARIRSADLRWDWFPRTGEVLSISGFYKALDKPIEQVFIAAASTAYSFQNAADGWLAGLEFDIRKRLDFVAAPLYAVTFQANLSLVESEVNVVSTGTFQPTNAQRPLEGQSSYSLNLGLLYGSPDGGSEIGAFYNRFGDRLRAAGGSGVPDIVEQPRNQLDASIKQKLFGNVRVKLKASNILDEPFRFEQEANAITQLQREYRTGVTFSFGMSYDF